MRGLNVVKLKILSFPVPIGITRNPLSVSTLKMSTFWDQIRVKQSVSTRLMCIDWYKLKHIGQQGRYISLITMRGVSWVVTYSQGKLLTGWDNIIEITRDIMGLVKLRLAG